MSLSTTPTQYLADREPPYINLSAATFFDQLTDNEKLYAHYMLKASYAGSRVVLRQVSHESEAIFDVIMSIHSNLQGKYPEGEETTLYLEYISQFLANSGNYNSFGDSKFIPRCPKEFFLQLLESAQISKASKPSTQSCLFETYEELIEKGVYYVDANSALLGFPSEGHTSAYYFGDVSQDDMTMLHKEVFAAHDIMPENVRIRKLDDKNFEILVASETKEAPKGYPSSMLKTSCGATVSFKFGDHSSEMKSIADYLEKAKEYAANDTQRDMLAAYIDHFRSGDMKAHKESQKLWVKDLSPIVETNIGFIETYREPSGIIGEYESLVAVTNKERTKKFKALVENAEKYISLLPWGPEFEKPVFTPPDFTSLEVLTFAGSGIPAGINIPNYDDVRTNIGFKNVSLGNILNATISTIKPSFVWGEDADLFAKYQAQAFEVQVGIHELLGHGSGLLLSELPDGSFNFPIDNPPLGIGNKPVTTYYKKGETWSSKFGQLAGPYEECRAEVIAMYLITNRELLSLFGFTDRETQDKIIYIGYLQMARAGLLALEYWDPNTEKWGQPHMQARFAIMKTFLEHASDKSFLQFVYTEEDFNDLAIKLNRGLVETVGRDSLTDFLRHLHIYKSSGDVDRGTEYFLERSSVPPHLARFRDIILKKKQPRRQFVQCNTFIDEHGAVVLHEYEASALGVLQSFAERGL